MEEKKTTHVIYSWPSQNLEKLYRVSDGVEIAVRQHAVCILGADPNKRISRIFMDNQYASDYLKIAAKDDHEQNGAGELEIETVPQEGLVTLAEGSLEMAGPGSFRKSPLTKIQ